MRDDGLRREVLADSRSLVLRVGRDVATADVLDSDVTDVETDVVPRLRLRQSLVVHLNRFALRLDTARCERVHHPGLQVARLNTPNRDSPDAQDLVDTLQRKTQRLLNRPDNTLTLSSASRSVGSLCHGMFFDHSTVLSPLKPEIGTNWM